MKCELGSGKGREREREINYIEWNRFIFLRILSCFLSGTKSTRNLKWLYTQCDANFNRRYCSHQLPVQSIKWIRWIETFDTCPEYCIQH